MQTRKLNGQDVVLTAQEEADLLAEREAVRARREEEANNKPDWPTFRASLLAYSSINRVYETAPRLLTDSLSQLMWRVGETESLLTEIKAVWNAISLSVSLTSEELAQINQLCSTTKMKFRLDSNGFMIDA